MDHEKNLIISQLSDANLENLISKLSINEVSKDCELSSEARLKGNKLYCLKSHTSELHGEIFHLYTKSIALAPNNSEELALGYSNRSVLLLHLKKYAESLQDIERSLFITASICLKVKLLCRKVEVLTALGCPDNQITFQEALKHFGRIPKNHEDKINLNKIINRANLILSVNQKILSPVKDINSEFYKKEKMLGGVEVKYSEKFGRHLIATETYKPGDIIFVEKPYAVCSNLEMPYFYCYHCLNVSWTGISCNFCSWCIFCSEKCRKEAWKKYHDIECLVVPYVKNVFEKTYDHLWLGVKILIMAVKEAGSIAKLRSELKDIDDNFKDRYSYLQSLLEDERINSYYNFKAIYLLDDKVSKNCLNQNLENAGRILACIIKYTPFFKINLPENQSLCDMINNVDVVFIGALLLKVFNIISCNKYKVSGSLSKFCNSKYPFECLKKNCSCCKGIFLTQISSLINNSCHPNVKRCFVGNNKIVLYALQPIEKNSQIFTSYLCSFYHEPNNDRKTLIEKEFFFVCNCIACERNWPSIAILSKKPAEEDDSLKNAKTSLIEKGLMDKYRDLIKTTHKNNSKINEFALAQLSIGIEEATKLLPQPNTVSCLLIMTLQVYFEILYGCSGQIFHAC